MNFHCCYVSAVSGQGIPALLEMMEARLIKTVSCKVQLPVAHSHIQSNHSDENPMPDAFEKRLKF